MTITVRHYAGKKLTNMTNIEHETLAMLKQAAKTYIAQSEREEERANRSELRDIGRASVEKRMAEICEAVSATRKVPEEVVWEHRRYEIARAVLPTMIENYECFRHWDWCKVNAPAAAIEIADELIKQLRGGGSSEIPNNQSDTRGYDKEGGER